MEKSKKKLINLEVQKEELWDFIAGSIGFDKKGVEIQNAIRKFIRLMVNDCCDKCLNVSFRKECKCKCHK